MTSLEREDIAGSLHTRVRALDGAARLMHGTRVAAHVDSTVADIVRKVAQGAGLTVGRIQASGGSDPAHRPGQRERLGVPLATGAAHRIDVHGHGQADRLRPPDRGARRAGVDDHGSR